MDRNWKKLIDTNGGVHFVNLAQVAYITLNAGYSLVHLAGRGDQNSIGAIAVTAMPSEILDGEALS